MLELLKNDIVINWIAPIVTGLIVVVIPTVIVKIFRFKKDEKMVKEANQRYLDAIMPFIIQKIKISSSYITDIRNVIISESGLKEKFVFSELSLRNKLIMDISESKYVDENNKKELIDFTYEIFKSFDDRNNLQIIGENETTKSKIKVFSSLISNPFILLLFSQLLMSIVVIFDKRNIKPEENILILLPFFLGFLSVFGIILKMISNIFDSNVSRKKVDREKDYRNFIVHYSQAINELNEKIKKNNKNDNKDINKNVNKDYK